MSDFDNAWGVAAQDTGSNDDSAPPPAGTYIAQIRDAKLFQSKAGEQVGVIEFATEGGQYQWADVRSLTKDGVPQPGRIKAFTISLRSLGIDASGGPAQTAAALPGLVGKWFALEVIDTTITRQDGSVVQNTNVISETNAPVSAPVQTVPVGAPVPAYSFEEPAPGQEYAVDPAYQPQAQPVAQQAPAGFQFAPGQAPPSQPQAAPVPAPPAWPGT